MENAFILIFLVFFSNSLLGQSNQHMIKIPIRKEYPEGQDHYEDWIKHIKEHVDEISDPTLHWESKSLAYWNKYNAYFKSLTDRSKDILPLFLDGFEYNPHRMCRNLLDIHNEFKSLQYAREYYKIELEMMNALCGCHRETYDQELIEKLKELDLRDQKFRSVNYRDITSENWDKQHKLDSLNVISINEIIEFYGFPDRNLVGLDVEEIIPTIILHSPKSLMKLYLPTIKSKVDKQLLPARYYPLLYDRIEWLSGRPQLYGTQYIYDRNGKAQLHEVKAPEGLENRRKIYNLK